MAQRYHEDDFRDRFEYHGSTVIEHTRLVADELVWRDWILFDTVEEAEEYYNLSCVN